MAAVPDPRGNDDATERRTGTAGSWAENDENGNDLFEAQQNEEDEEFPEFPDDVKDLTEAELAEFMNEEKQRLAELQIPHTLESDDDDDDNGFEEAGFIPDPDDDGYGDFDEDMLDIPDPEIKKKDRNKGT